MTHQINGSTQCISTIWRYDQIDQIDQMDQGEGFVLRIRGLPWQATREEIENFFSGNQISNGINI